jgi:hypothetical protein
MEAGLQTRRAADESEENCERSFRSSGFCIRCLPTVYHRRGVTVAHCSAERGIQDNMVWELASSWLVNLRTSLWSIGDIGLLPF